MKEKHIALWKNKIDRMKIKHLARLIVAQPLGHPIFVNPELKQYIEDRLESLGGMTPELERETKRGFVWYLQDEIDED